MKPLRAVLWVAACSWAVACGAERTSGLPVDPGHGMNPPDAGPVSCSNTSAGAFLPCDVEAIVAVKCRRCHDEPAALEPCLAQSSCLRAPFPLATPADTRRDLGGGTRVIDLLAKVIESGEMPYQSDSIQPPVEKLTAAEKTALVSWAKACAPGVDTACSR